MVIPVRWSTPILLTLVWVATLFGRGVDVSLLNENKEVIKDLDDESLVAYIQIHGVRKRKEEHWTESR